MKFFTFLVVLHVLLIHQAFTLRCPTCSGLACDGSIIPQIECNRRIPNTIVPNNREIFEDTEYGCLDLKFETADEIATTTKRCILMSEFRDICHFIGRKYKLNKCNITKSSKPNEPSTHSSLQLDTATIHILGRHHHHHPKKKTTTTTFSTVSPKTTTADSNSTENQSTTNSSVNPNVTTSTKIFTKTSFSSSSISSTSPMTTDSTAGMSSTRNTSILTTLKPNKTTENFSTTDSVTPSEITSELSSMTSNVIRTTKQSEVPSSAALTSSIELKSFISLTLTLIAGKCWFCEKCLTMSLIILILVCCLSVLGFCVFTCSKYLSLEI